MVKQKRIVGQKVGFLLGQAQPTMNPGSMTPNPAPFMNQSAPLLQGGNSPLFGGGGMPFQGGPGALAPTVAPGGTGGGGLGGILQGLLGGNGGLNLPSILSNAQKMIGAVNQAGEVFRNFGPMLQMFKGLNLGELLQDSDDDEELKEVDSKPKKKKSKRKRSKRKKKKRSHKGQSKKRTTKEKKDKI